MSSRTSNLFALESLEARILLSGVDVLGGAFLAAGAGHRSPNSHPIQHEISTFNDAVQQGQLPTAANQIHDIFSDVSGEILESSAAGQKSSSPQSSSSANETTQQAAPDTHRETTGNGTSVQDQNAAKTDSTVAVIQSPNPIETAGQITTKPNSAPASDTSISNHQNTEQLVDTLKAANGPPALSSVGLQGFDRILPLVLQAVSPRHSPDSLSDLVSIITNQLGSDSSGKASGTISDSLTPGDVLLSTFLQITAPTLTFSLSFSTDGTGNKLFTGTVQLSAKTASLSFGSVLTLTISGTGGGNGLTGSYTLSNSSSGAGSFALTAAQIALNIPSLLTASGSNLNITYAPAGAAQQTIATMAGFSASLIPFGNATATISSLTVRNDGFALADAQLNPGNFSIDGFLGLTAPVLNFSGVSYTNGGSLAGTVSVHAVTATLFPGKSFQATISPVSPDQYGLSGSLTVGSQNFSLTADQIHLALGDALAVDASGVQLSYSRQGAANQTLASIQSATASSTYLPA